MGRLRCNEAARPLVVAGALLLAWGCTARQVAERVPPPEPRARDTAALNGQIAMAASQGRRHTADYRIGPDDLLEVTLFDIEGKNGEPRQVPVRVTQSGVVTLPLIGQVEVGGKTPVEAEAVLREHYRRYIHEPQIAVFVKEYRAYRVSVVGYVEKPGVYEVTGERTLLEILAMAGGVNDKAGKTVQISRRHDDKLETLFVDLDRLAQEGDMSLNLTMISGDVVNVPRAGVVYVEGSVKKPGAYPLRESMTLTQAIGEAGGVDDKLGSRGGTKLFRRGAHGERREIPIDIGAIDGGEAEDPRLAENDIVVVPMSVPKYVVDRFIGGIGMGLSVPIF
jgi:polysaccharide export outer membrane protein